MLRVRVLQEPHLVFISLNLIIEGRYPILFPNSIVLFFTRVQKLSVSHLLIIFFLFSKLLIFIFNIKCSSVSSQYSTEDIFILMVYFLPRYINSSPSSKVEIFSCLFFICSIFSFIHSFFSWRRFSIYELGTL